jgi:hypothetical protein
VFFLATSDNLKNERNSYIQCLNNVRNTASCLEKSIKSLQSIISIQNSCYKVDDLGGGSNFINDLLEIEKGIYSNIINNIIPSTETKINRLALRINDALQKEALEKAGE